MSKNTPVIPEDIKRNLNAEQIKSAEGFYNYVIENRRSLESGVARGLVNVYQKYDGVVEVERVNNQVAAAELQERRSAMTDLLNDAQRNFDKFYKKRLAEGIDEAVLAPLTLYAKESDRKIDEMLRSNQKAREAVVNLHIKAGMLNALPNFAVPITPEYRARGNMVGGEIAGTDMRTIDKQEKEALKNQLLPFLDNLAIYKMENIVKMGDEAITELGSLMRDRVTEFFTDPLSENTYSLNQDKLLQNKERFVEAIEGDFAQYQIGLEYIAQFQKKNPEKKIDDVRRKEILNALNIAMDRNDASNLARTGGEMPERMMDKMNAAVAGYDILLSAMKEVGGSREYPERDKLIATLLPHLAEIDPKTLETNRKAITKLCTKAIDKHSSKSFPIFGDNTVTVKPEELDKMGVMLKASLAQFQQAPQQAVVARPNSLPAGMPLPSSPPVVDRSKLSEKNPALLKPRPPTTPFPVEAAARPVPRKDKKEQPKVVTAAALEKWEKGELIPHGMPAPEWQKANPTKPIPPVPLAVSINRPRSDAIDVGSVQQEDRPSSAPPSIVTPPIPPAPPMSPKSEVSHTSPSAPSESLKKNPVLEAEERSRREIEGWRSGYESLGFVGRLGVSKRPESHKNLGQSVKAWREWHEDNKEYLAKKKFALPAEYKDVMSKLQVAEDVGRVVGSVYSEESRGVLRELKHLDDDAARLSILRKEAENKRASREEHLRSAPANIISAGDVQEHDTPYPPPKVSKVDALNKEREEEKKKGSNMR